MFAKTKIRVALPAVLSLLCGAAGAATTCTMAISNLVFGGYDVFSPASLDTSATVTITCSRDGGPQTTNVTIAIGRGTYGGSTSSRKMKMNGGGDLLSYNLFRDAGRTAVWGETGLDAFTQPLAVPNKWSAQLTATIFGRIPASQDVSMGTYSDSVVVTVTP